MPRLFDDYPDLTGEVTQEEAEIALEDYITMVAFDEPIPPKLQEFILAGLARQLRDKTGGWYKPTRGRKKIKDDNEEYRYVSMLARCKWYSGIKGDSEARMAIVSDFLKIEFASIKLNFDISPSGVRRMIRACSAHDRIGFDHYKEIFYQRDVKILGLEGLSHAEAILHIRKNRGQKIPLIVGT